MSILNALLGNASEMNPSEAQKALATILGENETVEKAYKLIRDSFIFTNKRFIMIDVQGLTGKKVEYHSIPYRSIVHFSVETAGSFDLDAELKIWVTGDPMPIQKQFNENLNIYQLQNVLASYVCK